MPEDKIEKFPDLILRIKAAFVDILVILALMTLASYVFESMETVSDDQRIFVMLGIFLVVDPLCTSLLGGTIGHLAMGLRVKRENNTTKNINPLSALGRYIVKVLLGWISFLTVNSNPKKKALHDMLVHSVVIYK